NDRIVTLLLSVSECLNESGRHELDLRWRQAMEIRRSRDRHDANLGVGGGKRECRIFAPLTFRGRIVADHKCYFWHRYPRLQSRRLQPPDSYLPSNDRSPCDLGATCAARRGH